MKQIQLMWNIFIDLYTINIRIFILFKHIFDSRQTERNFFIDVLGISLDFAIV